MAAGTSVDSQVGRQEEEMGGVGRGRGRGRCGGCGVDGWRGKM